MRQIWLLSALFNVSLGSKLAMEIVQSEDLEQLFQYISTYELITRVIDDISQDFPEVSSTDEEMVELRRELMTFLTGSSPMEKEQTFAGHPSRFKLLTKKVKQLHRIARRDFPTVPESDKDVIPDEDAYFKMMTFTSPIYKALAAKMADYEQRGLTKTQIEEEIKEVDDFMMSLFFGAHEIALKKMKKMSDKFRTDFKSIYQFLSETESKTKSKAAFESNHVHEYEL